MRGVVTVGTVSVLLTATAGSLLGQSGRQESGTSAEFRGLHAASGAVVWATGRNGVYTRTTDGGAMWRADTIPGAADMFLVDVHAFDGTSACVLGTSFDGGLARIYRTEDGGRTWRAVYENTHPSVFFDGMAFWDRLAGVAFSDPVNGAFLVVRTTDGCRSWQPVSRDALPPPLVGEAGFAASGTAITVSGDSSGWIGTGGGAVARVLRTTDRGRSWTAHETPLPGGSTAGIFGLAFRDPDHGIAVGGDYQQRTAPTLNVLRTADGGRTWQLVSPSAPAGVRYGAAYVPGTPATLVATGPSGYGFSTDDGTTWTVIDTVSVNAVAAAGPEAVWVAGVEGRIWRIVPKQ